MRVAFIHDWLVTMRGGERCLEVIQSLYPDSEIFTVFYDAENVSQQIRGSRVHCSSLGRLPFVRSYYRYLLPLYPLAVRDISHRLAEAHTHKPFDLVISISHCVAKNVHVPDGVPHLCYCLTPVRYLWDQYDAYFSGRWYEPLTRIVAKFFRTWDARAAQRVTSFVAISDFVAKRIERYYLRPASVVYPPIDTTLWHSSDEYAQSATTGEEPYFLCVNALVPYKNTHVIIEAFASLPYRLKVIGKGPELARLKRLAGPRTEFEGSVSLAELRRLYQGATALVFAAEEDFGMTPLEIQACGKPVIAYARGGVLETVSSGVSGLFYSALSAESVRTAVEEFISRQAEFTVDNCISQAQTFGVERFMRQFEHAVESLPSVGAENAASAVRHPRAAAGE